LRLFPCSGEWLSRILSVDRSASPAAVRASTIGTHGVTLNILAAVGMMRVHYAAVYCD